jgi:hypothetical protein
MGDLRIVYTEGFPAEVKGIVEPLFEKWKGLAPCWCTEIVVYWKEDLSAKLSISVDEAQRSAEFFVHPNFMTFAHNRERAFVHELCHFYNSPLRWEAKETIEKIVGPDFPTPGSRIAESRLDEVGERQNNDLVALILKIAPDGSP